MTLVETFPGEPDDQFRAAIDALLQAEIPDRPSWWHPYEVRETYSCRGILFRHFYSIAGSLQCWLRMILKRENSRRILPFPSRFLTVSGPITMYGRGVELIIAPGELQIVEPNPMRGFIA